MRVVQSPTLPDSTELARPSREALVRLIEKEAVVPHFQPIVDLFSGEIFAYELLSRGVAPFEDPTVMFREAKGWGLSWELEDACRRVALRRIAEVSSSIPEVRFSVNVSPDIFSDERFGGGFTLRTLRELGIDVGRIIIEITETATVEDYDRFERIVGRYVDHGFRIALDDFSVGHSGLSTLVTVAPHFIKLDRSIMSGIEHNAYKQNMVKAMVSLAATVDSQLVAEGIETREQLLTVFRLGVRYAQGYLFGRPDPYPRDLEDVVVADLREMIEDFTHNRFGIEDISVGKMMTYPPAFATGTTTCETLEAEFRRMHTLDHVVILSDGVPRGLITRQDFLANVSGRYGFAVYQRRFIEEVAKREFLSVDQHVDIRALGRLAMGRMVSDLYDPIVVVERGGRFLGTITMKQLLGAAFDVEIKIATSLNPLTRLPGNIIIGYWLEEIFKLERYSVIYADLSRFKEYNDRYGFVAGDDLIRSTAQLLAERLADVADGARLGHIGGDDFIIVADDIPSEPVLAGLCAEFDARRSSFFSGEELANGWYHSTDRSGHRVRVPLVTLTLGVVTSENFEARPHPGQVSQIAAMVKRRSKRRGENRSASHYVYERRHYGRWEGGPHSIGWVERKGANQV